MELFIKLFVYTIILLVVLKIFFTKILGIEGFYSTNLFWGPFNEPIRSTRNMSYDLRGDVPLSHGYVGPWSANLNLQHYKYSLWRNISPYYPIQNKPLWLVS
jgi:hypothetical protein